MPGLSTTQNADARAVERFSGRLERAAKAAFATIPAGESNFTVGLNLPIAGHCRWTGGIARIGTTRRGRAWWPACRGETPHAWNRQASNRSQGRPGRAPPQRTLASSLALVVILAVIPPGPTAANQTALNGMPTQPELPRPDWSGLSGRLAVIS